MNPESTKILNNLKISAKEQLTFSNLLEKDIVVLFCNKVINAVDDILSIERQYDSIVCDCVDAKKENCGC